ncbi:MAG: hypothetical protein AB1585_00635 [Thermodesulfobacteriota bacterium]
MEDRSCKRCSVTRVNNLVKAYEKAHENGNSSSMSELREVVNLVKPRGYPEALRLLQPGLEGPDLRSFCWNVSSFLEDEELKRIFHRMGR